MIKREFNFLLNFSLLTNATYFALYKQQNNIELNGDDLDSMQRFVGILSLLNNSINNPLNSFEKGYEFLPLIDFYERSNLTNKSLSENIEKLSDVIINQAATAKDLSDFVKLLSNKLEEYLSEEMLSDNKEFGYQYSFA